MPRRLALIVSGFLVFAFPLTALADEPGGTTARDTGISAIWVLANLSYAGMRAQGSTAVVWRAVALLFGLPGTLISLFVVKEGGERAYGVDLPRKSNGE